MFQTENERASASADLAAQAEALYSGAALQFRPNQGVLQLTDNDRQDFLHRMTTNEINRLQAGESTVTILTNPTARTLFAFTVMVRTDDLLLLTGPDEANALARHLRGQIFFLDAVKVADVSAEWASMRMMGPAAGQALADAGLDVSMLQDGAWVEQEGVHILFQARFDVPGYTLLVPIHAVDGLVARVTDAGAVIINDQAYTQRRVELGRPVQGAELVEAYNPLEAGMDWVCADDKGCYTGQEIIARQVTYDKVTKTLVGLWSEHPMLPDANVQVDGRVMGTVTSAAYSPRLGRHLALAVLKRPANQAGVETTVNGQPAQVTTLPFSQAAQNGSAHEPA